MSSENESKRKKTREDEIIEAAMIRLALDMPEGYKPGDPSSLFEAVRKESKK